MENVFNNLIIRSNDKRQHTSVFISWLNFLMTNERCPIVWRESKRGTNSLNIETQFFPPVSYLTQWNWINTNICIFIKTENYICQICLFKFCIPFVDYKVSMLFQITYKDMRQHADIGKIRERKNLTRICLERQKIWK